MGSAEVSPADLFWFAARAPRPRERPSGLSGLIDGAYFAGKGLTRGQALARVRRVRDFRGFTYDPKSGWAKLT